MNTRGRLVAERIAYTEQHGGRDNPDLAPWFAEGEAIVSTLAGAMHGEIDPASVDERPIREWQAIGREFQKHVRRNQAELGQAVRDSGMSPEDAAQALSQAMRSGMSAQEAVDALRRGELAR
jgi:hypothetical protein